MAERPDRRCRIGVVRRDRPVGIDAKDLAAQRRTVLRQLRITDFAGRHIKLAVRSERDAPAVVARTRRNTGEDRRLTGQRAPVETHPDHAVVLPRGDVGEHRLTRRRETQQAALPARRDASHGAGVSHGAGRQVLDRGAVAFGDQRTAVS